LFLLLIEKKTQEKERIPTKGYLLLLFFILVVSNFFKKMLFASSFLEIENNSLFSLCLHRSKMQEK
jgi:hypothetical protein